MSILQHLLLQHEEMLMSFINREFRTPHHAPLYNLATTYLYRLICKVTTRLSRGCCFGPDP